MPSYAQFDTWQNTAGVNYNSVIQMVTSGERYFNVALTSSTLSDTGFNISITPKFATSKILILASLMVHKASAEGGGFKTAILRNIGGGGYTTIWGTQGNLAGWYADSGASNQNLHFPYHYHVVDTPGSNQILNYKVQGAPYINSQSWDFGNGGNYPMSLTAMEFAQ
jgi:hypothetical protein